MRIKLGTTPEELAQEEYEKQVALEKEIFQRNQLREKKLQELMKKQKKSRVIVIISLIVVIISLTVFGTYNTFFKKTIKKEDIKEVVFQEVKQFQTYGLVSFIKSNFNQWFTDLVQVKEDKLGIERITADLNSLSINNIVQISNTFARTYFSVDLEVKNKDIENPDKTITKGSKKKARYSFYIPIEYYPHKKGEVILSYGYRPVAEMSFFMNNRTDTHEVGVSDYLKFESEKVENIELESAKIKVDRVLSDLYAKKDVSQELYSNLTFNGYDAQYLNIINFEMYQETNKLGYNAIVKYLIKTREGFEYKMTSYLLLKKNGKTWRIAGML